MHSEEITVLNEGSVYLQNFFGGDLDVVNAARVSFNSYETEITEKSAGLINFLIKNKHATPFEHCVFKFYIKAPIFVAREWFRHRWSSFNEMSMRYHVPDKIDFFLPAKETIRKQVGKPGSYSFEPIENIKTQQYVLGRLEAAYYFCEDVYRDLLELGVAKEIARSALPVGQYTEFIWTVNARSLMNFLNLRNSSDAQYEIREYAVAIEKIFADIMPVTYKSWQLNNREAI
jgi:thymidylate synthase (FAD)